MKKFDAIIIGSGQAGTPLVFKMASQGKKVAFIEKEHLGGTCLNVGCTPTKTYVASARRMWDAQHGEDLGIVIPEGTYADLKKIKARKDALIQKSVSGIATGIEKNENITYFKGEAHFTGQKQVKVGKEEITADQIFINVGGRPFVPNGYDDVPYLTSTSILELEEIPAHLIIVGGSYIGLEFGQMFKRFGSQVTIVEMQDTIIGREDPETSAAILKFLQDEGIDFRLQAECITAKNEPEGNISVQVDCKMDGPPTIKGTHILMAVGRKANTDTLNLDATGVKTDKRGFIEVDDFLKTNVPGIYALGDCNGKGAFTHTAYNDYEIVAENMFDGKKRKVSDRITTYNLFVDPPMGRVGLTKKEAIEKGYNVLEAKREMSRISRAKEKGETNGFMSALIDADTDKILGACVLGTGGDEIITSLLNIMYADAPYQTIRDSVVPHPTISELIPTMLESLVKVSK
ncbi:FAD-containing oxidoreductase [Cyclobacterium qasimii]|uniref:PF00070 family, FAD-dependent NAD(P)-disulfide oxidoreductase n=2 Tax=Cyclobacterium qasimii TaxID=1350429 RepID=S7WW16_9BACT|nr:FAD-containing oxidoreductase [Cyclobacterium qasimii]EPR70969.1 PF00070 family, FAD-dependent NAD(P)-disulfide oxidoreductase [Cyclobacterium qasimii M12-11B]GEO19878.1 mercuric reductase [Cyclobacterium qasimii]